MSFRLLRFASLPSTSSYLKENLLSLPSGTVAYAESQTNGHGRLGRGWSSENGGLAFSLLLKEKELLPSLSLLPLLTGAAISRAFEKEGAEAMIKWPNDVYIASKKAAGILLEGMFEGSDFLGVVIGIGVNLNQSSFPEGLENATSLYLSDKRKRDPISFLSLLLNELEEAMGKQEEALGYLSSHDFLAGKEICLDYYGEGLSGLARGIDGQGRLLLQLENGAIKKVSSGEATLHPKDKK